MKSVTFGLPGDGRSGGVRVTAIMANLLMSRGYQVRIILPKRRKSIKGRILSLVNQLSVKNKKNAGFLHVFRGPVERYTDINSLSYREGEVVIAVGTYSVADVRKLARVPFRVRFNHGFPAKPTESDLLAWKGRMPTITVSTTLVPKLQVETEGSVWGVVPNGIDRKDYYVDLSIKRLGIGALYNSHPNKAPADMRQVLKACQQRWPDVPQYVFSTELRPKGLEHADYHRLPSVGHARELYNQSKVWLLTSRTEGLPGVVLEAMACGCVVVSTDNDGSLEILRHDQNGLIGRRGNIEELTQLVGRIINDEQLRLRLQGESLITIDRFTWEAAAEKMERFLADVPALCARECSSV